MKYGDCGNCSRSAGSHPVRGAWIEIGVIFFASASRVSHPVRGAWIEMALALALSLLALASHPVRGAWIEIASLPSGACRRESHPVRGAWIEICLRPRLPYSQGRVAPREGCVD